MKRPSDYFCNSINTFSLNWLIVFMLSLFSSGLVFGHDVSEPNWGIATGTGGCDLNEGCNTVNVVNATEADVVAKATEQHDAAFKSPGFDSKVYGSYSCPAASDTFYDSGWIHGGGYYRYFYFYHSCDAWDWEYDVGDYLIYYPIDDSTEVERYINFCSDQYHEPDPLNFGCRHINQAPIIGNTFPDSAATEGEFYSYNPLGTDVDSYPDTFLFYEIVNQPYWATFDPFTGALYGTPNLGDAGLYSGIQIIATDGDLTDSVFFSINVAVGNHAPTIQATPQPTAALQGEFYSYQPTSTDQDGDTLTFSIDNSAPTGWNNFAFSTTTGQLSGTPTTAGSYNFTVTVSDGIGSNSVTFSITVGSNSPPIALVDGPIIIEVGKAFKLNGASSFDNEGKALTYSWDFGEHGSYSTASPVVTFLNTGDYSATLTVNDGFQNSIPAPFQVSVVDYDPNLNLAGRNCSALTSSALANGSNPINGATGNKYQAEVDYVGAGSMPLRFVRHYNSFATSAATSLGNNWRGTYDAEIVIDTSVSPNTASVYRPDGNVIVYQSISGEWQARVGITERLESITGGFQFTTNNDGVEIYDSAGRIESIANRAGLALSVNYSAGKLSSVDDGFGRSLTFEYYTSGADIGRLKTLTDPASGETTYTYDAFGNLETVIYPDYSVRTYIYDDPNFAHALTGIIDENNDRYATWAYDAKGRGRLSTHAGGANQVELVYNADGTTTITDAKGQARIYSYGNESGVLKVGDIAGPACTVCGGVSSNNTYDANGFMDLVTDFNGNVTDYDYNTRGLEEQRIEAVGTLVERTTKTVWHPDFRVPVCSIQPYRTIIYEYYTNGQLKNKNAIDTSDTEKFSTPESKTCTEIASRGDLSTLNTRSVSYTYYPTGLLKTVDGPRTDVSDITTYFYDDATGNLTEIRNALNHPTLLQNYDLNGRPRRIIDPNGLVTTITYDYKGRLDVVTIGDEETDYDYDLAGNLDFITLPDDSFIDNEYDEAHRLTDVYDHLGNHIHYDLDDLGNREQTDIFDDTGVLRRTKSAIFNQANNLEQIIGAVNQTTDFLDYDGNGNLKHVRDPELNNTFYTYDELNRLETITDALTGVTTNGYDAHDNLTSVQDPRNLTTIYTYDGLDNLKELDSPDSGVTRYTEYDAAGNLKSKTDARNKTTAYTYDALNRIKTITYDDNTSVVYSYDIGEYAIGRLSSIIDVTGTTSWSYDAHGRISGKAQSNGLSTAYSYNAVTGLLENTTTPGGKVLVYGYTDGQTTSITVDGQTILSDGKYDPFGPLNEWVWGNGAVANRTYNQDGQLENYLLGSVARTLQYYPAGNVHHLLDPNNATNTQSFIYDDLHRLEDYTAPGIHEVYGYDANGNRDVFTIGAQSYTNVVQPDSNRIDSVGGPTAKSYGYDQAGNQTSDGTNTFTYDDRNRLVNVSRLSGTASLDYSINALGQRIRKQGNQSPQNNDINGDGNIDGRDVNAVANVILGTGTVIGSADCNQDDSVNVLDTVCINNAASAGNSTQPASATIRFAYNEQGQLLGEYDDVNNPIQETVWFNGMPVAILQGSEIYYVSSDHLNTPRAVTNSTNTMVWSWVSDPFGVSAPNQDPDGDGALFVYNLRFPGQYFDGETGLHYNYFRDYDPSTGRYLISDPIGLNAGVNTYGYVVGNPNNLTDSFGLELDYLERRIGATRFGGHTFLRATPDNPSAVNQYVSLHGGGEYKYFESYPSLILSGMNSPDGSTLFFVANWEHDNPDVARYSKTLTSPDYNSYACYGFSNDTIFIGEAILGARKYTIQYPNGLPYDGLAGAFKDSKLLRGSGKPFPAINPNVEYYNSNSMTSGLLNWTGYSSSNIPDPMNIQPGLDKPVPIR